MESFSLVYLKAKIEGKLKNISFDQVKNRFAHYGPKLKCI